MKSYPNLPYELSYQIHRHLKIGDLFEIIRKPASKQQHKVAVAVLLERQDRAALSYQHTLLGSWLNHLARRKSLSLIKNFGEYAEDTIKSVSSVLKNRNSSYEQKIQSGVLINKLYPYNSVIRSKIAQRIISDIKNMSKNYECQKQMIHILSESEHEMINNFLYNQLNQINWNNKFLANQTIKKIVQRTSDVNAAFMLNELSKMLSHGNAFARQCAVWAMGKIIPLISPEDIKILSLEILNKLNDEDQNVRDCAAVALRELIEKDPETGNIVTESILDKLNHSDLSVRVSIRFAIKQIAQKVSQECITRIAKSLMRLLENVNNDEYEGIYNTLISIRSQFSQEIAHEVLEIILTIKKNNISAISFSLITESLLKIAPYVSMEDAHQIMIAIMDEVNHEDNSRRADGFSALGDIIQWLSKNNADAILTVLLKTLNEDEHWHIQANATEALGKIQLPVTEENGIKITNELFKRIINPVPAIRSNAIGAILKLLPIIPKEKMLEIMGILVEDETVCTSTEAENALETIASYIPQKDAYDAMTLLLDKMDTHTTYEKAFYKIALSATLEDAEKMLIDLLTLDTDNSLEIMGDMAAHFSEYELTKFMDEILKLLNDPDTDMASIAIEAICNIGSRMNTQNANKLMENLFMRLHISSDVFYEQEIPYVLSRLTPCVSRENVIKIMNLLVDKLYHEDVDVQKKAAKGLSRLSNYIPQAEVDDIMDILFDKLIVAPDKAKFAIEGALSFIAKFATERNTSKVLPIVFKKLSHDNKESRAAAKKTLHQIYLSIPQEVAYQTIQDNLHLLQSKHLDIIDEVRQTFSAFLTLLSAEQLNHVIQKDAGNDIEIMNMQLIAETLLNTMPAKLEISDKMCVEALATSFSLNLKL